MTPEEVLAAAERVRKIVAREEAPPFDVEEFLRVLKEGDCHGFRPPERPQPPMGPQPPRTTLCPNFPNPCYCTGACMRLGDYRFRPTPGRLTVYC